MKINYDYITVKTILEEIVWGNAFHGKYLIFDLEGTSGYIGMNYYDYIEKHFPDDLDNEIEETATIIHDSMNEECWIDIDSRELLAAFIIDFFQNTFNLNIKSDLQYLKSEMFNKMFEDLGEPNDYVSSNGYAYLKE